MYISLYRKYRPQTFSDMVEQDAAVCILQNSLKNKKLGHAYLFSGPRGCGKTSAARLLAKALNCLAPTEDKEPCGECINCKSITSGEHLDVIEIDGASNRRISEIRELKTHIDLKPLSSLYKVYIIDEVHMLTEESFNALLKTLEEPPLNVFFVLATTEPHKVPVTIRSRCQHIPFHRISIKGLVERITYVCECEKVSFEKEAIWEIGRLSDGALRDALSLSEQAIVLGKGELSLASVKELTGGGTRAELENWILDFRNDQSKAVLNLDDMLSSGVSPESFCEALFIIFRDLWLYRLWGDSIFEVLEISEDGRTFLKNESASWSSKKLKSVCDFCNSLLPRTRYGMKKEVFSGIIMLKLYELLTNEEVKEKKEIDEKTNYQAQVNVPEKNIPIAKKISQVTMTKQDTSKTLLEKNKNPDENILSPNTTSVRITSGADNTLDINELCSELGIDVLTKIICKTQPKDLLIISALLNVIIKLKNNERQFEFPSSGLSKTIISLPSNKKLLIKIIKDVYSVNVIEKKEVEVLAPLAPSIENKVEKHRMAMSDSQDVLNNKKISTKALASPDRILKLLGAEILYVQETDKYDEMEPLNCEGDNDE